MVRYGTSFDPIVFTVEAAYYALMGDNFDYGILQKKFRTVLLLHSSKYQQKNVKTGYF